MSARGSMAGRACAQPSGASTIACRLPASVQLETAPHPNNQRPALMRYRSSSSAREVREIVRKPIVRAVRMQDLRPSSECSRNPDSTLLKIQQSPAL